MLYDKVIYKTALSYKSFYKSKKKHCWNIYFDKSRTALWLGHKENN